MGVLNNREINENELINDGRDKPSEVYPRVVNEQDHEQLSPKEMTDADELDVNAKQTNGVTVFAFYSIIDARDASILLHYGG